MTASLEPSHSTYREHFSSLSLRQIEVTASTKVIYDFYGFPAAMYRYHWLAPEDPTLAHRVVDLLKQANFDTVYNDDRGLDHGTWVPLALMYPDADVPVVQVTLHKSLSLAKHIELGRALRPLIDEGVLIVGSGSSTHNLRELRFGGIYSGESDDWVESWEEDLRKIIENEDLNEREKQLLDIVNHVRIHKMHILAARSQCLTTSA
jgi:aromatic ring-opening dioxygenase catalytic subunit (LigB family)